MNSHLLSLLLAISTVGGALAQAEITGTIMDGETRAPIAYANVGLPDQNVGTISNVDGTFVLRVPRQHPGDTLTIYALGFEPKRVPVRNFLASSPMAISLEPKPVKLAEVVVNARREKNKRIEAGNKSFNGGVLETDTLYAGRSIALLIKPDAKNEFVFPAYIEKASLRILKNNLDTLRFRVRLNARDSLTGKPGKDLLHESIVAESAMRKGWLDFDLSQFNHLIDEPFFVTFEQILDLKDRTKIADGYREFMRRYPEHVKFDTVEFEGKKEVRQIFTGKGIDSPGTFISIDNKLGDRYDCYERDTSFGEWKKVYGIPTALVTMTYRLPDTVK